MNKKLESYLTILKQELGALEAEQRDSELREMRQHIEAIVARLVEGGLNENEAIEAAIAQFGVARKVGRELNCVSAENDCLRRVLLSPIGALTCVVFTVLYGFTPWLISALKDSKYELPAPTIWLIAASNFARSPFGALVLLSILLIICIFTRIFHKRIEQLQAGEGDAKRA